jgi:hypothetical protein
MPSPEPEIQANFSTRVVATLQSIRAQANSIESDIDSNYLTKTSASATYLTQNSASSIYLDQSSASATYLTQSSASATYLTQSSASATYLTQSSASATYLTQSSASATYSPISSPTFTGTLSASVVNVSSNTNISGSASITGNLAVDTNTLFVDSVNDRVGIKTSSPSVPLHISHSGETIRLTDGTRTAYLGVDANNPWFGTSTNHDMRFITNGASRMRLNNAGHLVPETTNTYDLGTTSLRWRNIYTQDLHLSNGIGDYTIVEGEEDLFLTNNKNGKSYKFALIEVDSSEVPPKSES